MKKLLAIIRFVLLSFSLLLIVGCSVEDSTMELNSLLVNDAKFEARHAAPVFTTSLKGKNEVPAVDTRATGTAILKVNKDQTSIDYKLIVANIENVVASHLHIAAEGVSGPVVAFLYSGPADGHVDGVLAEGTLTSANLIGQLAGMTIQDLISVIEEGRIYVNVHTLQVPSGEIRGQL